MLARVLGCMEGSWVTVYEDLPSIWPVEPGQNAHERALARPIFAQQRMHFPPPRREIDISIGDHARESLVNTNHLDGQRLFVHARLSLHATNKFFWQSAPA